MSTSSVDPGAKLEGEEWTEHAVMARVLHSVELVFNLRHLLATTDVGSTIWKNVDLSITGRFPWVPGVSQRDDSPSNNVLTLTAAVNLAGLAGREVYWDAVFVRPGCC